MHVPNSIRIWILAVSCFRIIRGSAGSSGNGRASDMKEFFDQIEKVMNRISVESKSEDAGSQSDPRRLRYLIPEAVMNQQKAEESIYSSRGLVASNVPNGYPPRNFFYNSEEMGGKNTVVDFEGYQEFVFRPRYQCDLYDSTQRRCVFRRQLGTTLTLGVQVGEGLHRGMHIYWFRCLRKKYYDHIIKEPLNKGFLPWNLNLGGSGNELRISPISEMDISYNYFVAELATPRAYKRKDGQKPAIRFHIEPIEIDMGSLYHGEEIIIYARSFMEVPRTSVNFVWSLQEKGDFDDYGLPSNMKLNADRSSVIIKELKTFQDQYLVCKAYSNKDFLLVRRSFLFRGSGNNKTTSIRARHKRDIEDEDESDDDSNSFQYEEIENPTNAAQSYGVRKRSDGRSEQPSTFREVPEISENLFYDGGKRDSDSRRRSFKDGHELAPAQNDMEKIMRKFMEQEEYGTEEPSRSKRIPVLERPKFEDIESQMIATCRTHSDCNFRAICIRAPEYGQNYCKCPHGFNGNGLFCFNS